MTEYVYNNYENKSLVFNHFKNGWRKSWHVIHRAKREWADTVSQLMGDQQITNLISKIVLILKCWFYNNVDKINFKTNGKNTIDYFGVGKFSSSAPCVILILAGNTQCYAPPKDRFFCCVWQFGGHVNTIINTKHQCTQIDMSYPCFSWFMSNQSISTFLHIYECVFLLYVDRFNSYLTDVA